jgi:ATP-dependent DNA ligase
LALLVWYLPSRLVSPQICSLLKAEFEKRWGPINEKDPNPSSRSFPTRRPDPFDDPACLFEIKLDGFRALADNTAGRFISKNGNALTRFASVLDTLPNGYVFDGELVALDADGRPMFNDLMFGRREPVFVPFDVLVAEGENVIAMPLKDRKALLTKIVRRYRLQKLDWVIGEGKAAFRAVCELDLEGIVAKRMTDAYRPETKWWKILNRNYSQKEGRAELFERRYG